VRANFAYTLIDLLRLSLIYRDFQFGVGIALERA